VVRVLTFLAFLLAGQALAGECGPRIGQAQIEPLTQELQKGVFALAAYGESLASRAEANGAHQLVQQLIVLHERMGRVAQLAEIRDAMRHDGEKSLVQFKLSHEASLLKLVSSRASRGLEDLLLAQRGIAGPGPDRLRQAVSRAEALFAACDSPM
jgi:hypothetical protein